MHAVVTKLLQLIVWHDVYAINVAMYIYIYMYLYIHTYIRMYLDNENQLCMYFQNYWQCQLARCVYQHRTTCRGAGSCSELGVLYQIQGCYYNVHQDTFAWRKIKLLWRDNKNRGCFSTQSPCFLCPCYLPDRILSLMQATQI